MDKALLDYEVSVDADCKLLTVGKPFAIEGINQSFLMHFYSGCVQCANLASHKCQCQRQRAIHLPLFSFSALKHSAIKLLKLGIYFLPIPPTYFYPVVRKTTTKISLLSERCCFRYLGVLTQCGKQGVQF